MLSTLSQFCCTAVTEARNIALRGPFRPALIYWFELGVPMRFNLRSVGLASVSLVGAALMAVSGSATAMAADKVVMIGGIGVGTIPPRIIPLIAGGMYNNDDVTTADWPAQAAPYTGKTDLTLGASIKIGVASLSTSVNQALASATGNETVTILGMSAGSLVVDELMRQWETTGTGPDPSKLNIVVEADSSRQATITGPVYNKQYNYTYQPPVEVPYNITVVTREYDGTCDFPDHVWNLLAVANAYAGAIVLHDGTFLTDLSTVPAADITVSAPNSLGGVTTNYLLPTATLPLVTLMPWLAPQAAALRVKIDKGYSRNDPPATAAAATTTGHPLGRGDHHTGGDNQGQVAEFEDHGGQRGNQPH